MTTMVVEFPGDILTSPGHRKPPLSNENFRLFLYPGSPFRDKKVDIFTRNSVSGIFVLFATMWFRILAVTKKPGSQYHQFY
jgi:hypothetical protein